VANNKKAIYLILLIAMASIAPGPLWQNAGIKTNAQGTPTYIELGYSPGTLGLLSEGTPIYAPGDSLWIFSTSNIVSIAQLFSPSGNYVAGSSLSESAAYALYKFQPNDPEGNWLLKLTLKDSSVVSVAVPFVNPNSDNIDTRLLNYSTQYGKLNMEFQVSAGRQPFNLEACLGSSNVNSTFELALPSSLGTGQLILNNSLSESGMVVRGSVANPFTFWFDMEYSYSYAGSLTGELISRDISVVSSDTATFGSSLTTSTVLLSNNTTPRPGPYQLNAFFDSNVGLSVEQTNAILLKNGTWIATGNCSSFPVSSLTFQMQQRLSQSPDGWPRNLYLSYDTGGVNSYSSLPLGLNECRIDIVGSVPVPSGRELPAGFNPQTSITYLNYSVGADQNMISYSVYNGSAYIFARNFPITVQITPSFGTQNLPPLSVEITKPFSVHDVSIALGSLQVEVTNNTSPVVGAKILVTNDFGGNVSTLSDSSGFAQLYLPGGSYNATVSVGGFSATKNASVADGSFSTVQFAFAGNAPPSYVSFLLASLFIVGLMLNLWLWVIRPRREGY
jgi:hypothetical protein